ncbi:MAG: hypothetical protein V7542_09645 [Limnobacter sp.]|uniref:hypothetical protein n=1 Tax=Limnobacter sp. TaxID=2003368 RepID=UPI0030039476
MRRVFNGVERSFANITTLTESACSEDIGEIQTAWAQALRCECSRTRDAMLCRLAETTQELAYQHPNNAKVLLWNGIVLTGYAKSLGGLCALQFQAKAKTSLERAIELAPNDGAAFLYLGLLYDHAPAAPYGFGDERIAKSLLEQGLKLTLNSADQIRRA